MRENASQTLTKDEFYIRWVSKGIRLSVDTCAPRWLTCVETKVAFWSSRRNPATQIRSPRTCVTRNSKMRPLGKRYLHHCSFRSEKESADRRQAYHSHEESLMPTQSFFAHARMGGPVHELSSCQKRNSSREMEKTKRTNSRWFRAEIRKHEFEADSERGSIQELNGIIESQRRETDHTTTWCEQTSTRSTTSSRTVIRTKSGSSWSSYQKSFWDGRIEAISRDKN